MQVTNGPTRDGYVCIGWTYTTSGGDVYNYYTEAYRQREDADFILADNLAQYKFKVSRATTLYALWEPAKYTIHYDGNDGTQVSGAETDQIVTRGTGTSSLMGEIFTRTGYTFLGWGTSKAGASKGNVQYGGGETIQTDVAAATVNNITLYAGWEAKTHKLFLKNSTDNADLYDETEVTYASSYGQLPTPTRDGYIFAGWYAGSYDTPFVRSGSKITATTTVLTDRDHRLYATWNARTDTKQHVKHLLLLLAGSFLQV